MSKYRIVCMFAGAETNDPYSETGLCGYQASCLWK